MKKHILIALTLLMAVVLHAQTVTFTASDWAAAQSLTSGATVTSYSQDGVTVTFRQETGNAVTWNGTAIAAASGNTMTVAAPSGYQLESASFTVAGANAQATRLAGNAWSTGSAAVNSSNSKQVDWTGSTATLSVTFTGTQTFANFSFSMVNMSQTYTVTFVDINGNILKTEDVLTGGSATAPTPPTVPNMVFTGWSADFTNVTEDMVIRALYDFSPAVMTDTVVMTALEIRDYNELSNEEVFDYADYTENNVTVQINIGTGNAPRITYYDYSYRISIEKGNTITVSAPYMLHKIALQIGKLECNYSDCADYGIQVNTGTVSLPSSRWSGSIVWEGSASSVTFTFDHSAYYNIQCHIYDITAIGDASANQCTVNFYGLDGNIAKTQQVAIGGSATPPAITHECFGGWDKDYTNVRSDLEVYALSTVTAILAQEWEQTNNTSLTFTKDGFTITAIYPSRTKPRWYGGNICFSPATRKEGFTISRTAPFQEFSITCLNEERAAILMSGTCSNGTMTQDGAIVRWRGNTNSLTFLLPSSANENVDVVSFNYACEYYEQVPCVVIFQDENGLEIARDTVMAGEAVTPPAAPASADPCNEFVGWSEDVSRIISDVTIHPIYERSKLFSLTAREWGTTNNIDNHDVMTPITVNGFTLSGGDYYIQNRYDTIMYIRSWGDHVLTVKNPDYLYNLTIVCKDTTNARKLVTAGTCSTGTMVQDSIYVRWIGATDSLAIACEESAQVKAFYSECQHIANFTVTFLDRNDQPLSTQIVPPGGNAIAPADPTPENNCVTFAGWDQLFTNVRTDLTIRPIWNWTEGCIPEGHVKVIFIDFLNNPIDSQFVLIGGNAIAPEVPDIAGHTFAQWDKPLTNITVSETITAEYIFDIHSPTIFSVRQARDSMEQNVIRVGEYYAYKGIVTGAPESLEDGGRLSFTVKDSVNAPGWDYLSPKKLLGPGNKPFVSKYQIEENDTVYVFTKRKKYYYDETPDEGYVPYVGKVNINPYLFYLDVPDAALMYDINADNMKQAFMARTTGTYGTVYILPTGNYAERFMPGDVLYSELPIWVGGNTLTNFPMFVEDINHDRILDLGLPFSTNWNNWHMMSLVSSPNGMQFLDSALIIPNFDANGDGRLDYVRVNQQQTSYSNASIDIYYQQADGTFKPEHMVIMTWDEYQASFDPTAWAELANNSAGGYSSGGSLIVANTGYCAGMAGLSGASLARAPQRGGNRAPSLGYTVSAPTRALDMNADGLIDLVDEKNGIMYMNMGDGKWVITNTNGIVVPADLNNDGLMDFIFPGTQLYTSIYQGEGQFTTTSIYSNAAVDNLLYCYDFDRDGDIDILATFSATTNATGVAYTCFFLNDGQGNFTQQPEQNYGTERLVFSACQDLNGNGYMDLLAFRGQNDADSIDIVWLQANANNSFQAPQLLYNVRGKSINYLGNMRINVEDLSGNGKPEVWVSGLNLGKTDIIPFTTGIANSAPTASATPTLLYDNGKLTVSWGNGGDTRTQTGDLTYALRIGTTPGGDEILAADANANGARRNYLDGNMGKNHSYTVDLSSYAPCSLFVAVQAIDAQHVGSAWSQEATAVHVTLPASFTLSRSIINFNEQTEVHYTTLPEGYIHNWTCADGTLIEESGSMRLSFPTPGEKVITHTVTAPNGQAASYSATMTVMPAGVSDPIVYTDDDNLFKGNKQYKFDYDYDGKLDMLQTYQNLTVWQAQSLDEYTQAVGLWNTNLSEGTSSTGSLYLLDFNKNGFTDIILGKDQYYLPHADNAPDMIAKVSDSNTQYFLDRANGYYNTRLYVDLLHNGYPTVSYQSNYTVNFWQQLSDGSWAAKTATLNGNNDNDFRNVLGYSNTNNCLQDYDRDGFADALYLKYEYIDYVGQKTGLTVYKNLGNAAFQELNIPFTQNIAEEDLTNPQFVDLNSDGYIDIIATRGSDYAIYILWNNQNQSFSEPDMLPMGELLEWCEYNGTVYGLEDLDNNGYVDIFNQQHNPELAGENCWYVWYMGPQGVMAQGFISQEILYSNDFYSAYPNEVFLSIPGYYTGYPDYISYARRLEVIGAAANTAPQAPTGVRAAQTADGLLIEWNAAEDDHTTAKTMRYNLSVKHAGATGAGAYVISPQNGGQATSAYLPSYAYISANRYLVPVSVLTAGNYEIALQAIDQRNLMSEFSAPITVYVDRQIIEAPTTLCAGDDALITYMGASRTGTPVWNFDGGQVTSGAGFGPFHVTWNTPGTKTITLNLNGQTYTRMLFVDLNDAYVSLPATLLDGSEVEVTLPKNMSEDWAIIIDGSEHSITSKGIDNRDQQLRVVDNKLVLDTRKAWNPANALTNFSPLTLVLTLTNDNGCEATIQQSLTIVGASSQPQIRLVTANADGHNVITWNADAAIFPQIQVLKETNVRDQFVELGTVNTSAGSYVDLSSDATQRSERYAIRGVMTGGVKTPASTVHQTVHMTINRGQNDNQWNLIWNQYVGADVITYNILRGSSETNLQQIASVSSYNTSFTDNVPDASKPFYAIEYVLNSQSGAPTRPGAQWETMTNPSGRSNIVNRSAARTVTYAQSMTILSANGSYETTEDQPLLLLYAEIMPTNTTYKNVAWSITSGSDLATIDQSSGLFSAKTPNNGGLVVVKATATDGSGVTATRQIIVESILVTDLELIPETQPGEQPEFTDPSNRRTETPVKIIREGKFYILMPNGTEYDAMGRKAK
ncbi:MAG: VCBS repeat-containing protein [Paludibacteraceae bacterium]|nr:VCBS repeat-containing protein [Paludibacteraceae bacterium]